MACTKNFSYRSISAISPVFSCSPHGLMKWDLTIIPILQSLWWFKLSLPQNTWGAVMEWLSWSDGCKHLKCSNWKCCRCSAKSHLPAAPGRWTWTPFWTPFWGDSRLYQVPRCFLCKTEDPWRKLKQLQSQNLLFCPRCIRGARKRSSLTSIWSMNSAVIPVTPVVGSERLG